MLDENSEVVNITSPEIKWKPGKVWINVLKKKNFVKNILELVAKENRDLQEKNENEKKIFKKNANDPDLNYQSLVSFFEVELYYHNFIYL